MNIGDKLTIQQPGKTDIAIEAKIVPRCSECGEVSVAVVQDVEELPSKDGEWRNWKPKGKPVPLCLVHNRPSRNYMLDGSVKIQTIVGPL